MPRLRIFPHAVAAAVAAGAVVATALSVGASAQTNDQRSADDQVAHAAQMRRPDRCAGLESIDKKLTPEQVRDIVAGRLAQSGLNTLKAGKVHTTAEGAVAVDITTTSGSLVTTREISPKTGLPAALDQRCEQAQARRNADAQNNNEGEHRPHIMGAHFGGPMMHRPMMGPMARDAGPLEMLGNGGPGHDLNLTADQARKLADAELVRLSNPRLKVGAVKEKDADTMTVDIVTQDNALVLREEVDRHNGRLHRAT